MLRRLFVTLTVTTALSGLYVLYSLTVTPRLVPPGMSGKMQPPSVEASEPPSLPPPGNIEDAERFLPEVPWAARARFQIRLAKGLLYFQRWQPIDEAQHIFECRPFAMIWFDAPNADGDNGDDAATRQRPLTLIADAGLIRFSSKFEPTSQKIGRVIDGKLVGQVSATGPDGMSLKGQDLFFSEQMMKLYSDLPVEFTYQQHRGNAEHGLQVDLLPSNEPSRPDQTISIGGFRRVLLRGNVNMELSTNDGPMHVACDEGFDFIHESRTASFKINVAVTRPDEAYSLRCRYLDLFLKDDTAVTDEKQRMSRGDAPGVVPIAHSNVGSNGEVGSRNADDVATKTLNIPATGFGRQALRKLLATGPRVELESKRNGLTALMTSLVHDVSSRTTVLKDAESVIVRQQGQGNELRCPEITLVQDEQGQIESVHGYGPGSLRRREPGVEEVDFAAEWASEFQLQPDPDSELDVLTLLGHVDVKQPTKATRLSAEQIRIWFDRPADGWDSPPTARAEVVAAADGSPLPPLLKGGKEGKLAGAKEVKLNGGKEGKVSANEAPSSSVPESAARRLQPRQLQAQDNVKIVSPQLTGQSQRLIVFFEEGSPGPSELADGSESPRRVRPVSRRSTTSDADENANERHLGDKTKSLSSNDSPDEPLQLTAELIKAKVKLASQNDDNVAGELSEVWTEGNVEVQQARGHGEEPLQLTGQRLHLRNNGGDGQVLHVVGQPAVIRDRGFDIEGNEVFFDRRKNVTWIKGAGALRLPVKNDLDGRKLGSPSLLTVWWKEKMTFDGQTATFIDDVKATLNDSGLKCAEMDVVLTERIAFSGDRRHAPQAEVRKVICKDGVAIDHSLYVDQELTEIRRGRFATLTLDPMSGATEAIGPGQVALWRPGRGKRAALAPRAVAQANRPLESEVSNWEFTRVTFFGKTTGNMRDRQTSFHDRVSIVYGPVAHPLDTIDPDYLPKDGGEMECDKLQILQQHEAATKKNYIELRAEGNAKLEGSTFNARADAITFDESKELYTLRSTGSRQVTIWRQTQPGGDYDEVSAKSMRFIPSRKFLDSDQTTGIRGSN